VWNGHIATSSLNMMSPLLNPDFPQNVGILAIQPLIRAILHIFLCACTKLLYFCFWSKIWHCRSVPPFPKRRKNFGDSCTFMADIALLIFALKFRTFWPKIKVWGKIGEGLVQCWPQRTCFTFGGFYICANFGENRSRNATMRVHTDRYNDAQTQTGFIICPVLYAIAMEQINIRKKDKTVHQRSSGSIQIHSRSFTLNVIICQTSN